MQGVDCECLLENCDRLIVLAHLLVTGTLKIERVCVVGIELGRLLEGGQGVRKIIARVLCQAEVVPSLRIVGIESNGLVQECLCIVQSFEHEQRDALVDCGLHQFWIFLEGCGEDIGGALGGLLAHQGDAAIVQENCLGVGLALRAYESRANQDYKKKGPGLSCRSRAHNGNSPTLRNKPVYVEAGKSHVATRTRPRELHIYTSRVIAVHNQIDWGAFLGRPLLPRLSPEMVEVFAGKTLLITGAGGSIGSALALRLAAWRECRLVLLEASEIHLHQLRQAMAGTQPDATVGFVLGNAGDIATLEEIFTIYRPHLVFHAAAYKHVPLLENQPLAAIANNVFVTEELLAAAVKHRARLVLLSTDKAVGPSSVLGATKRIAEEMVLARGGTALRLANVLGSSGSVTEVFARQIACGGPLTVTDPEARRYFLTMGEAVDLLLEAAVIGEKAATTTLLCPALESDHNIASLARFMARALAPGREIPVHFTGLRPGDKLVERLWDEDESADSLRDGLLAVRLNSAEPRDLSGGLGVLGAAVRERDAAAALTQLRALVPGYRPSETALAGSAASRVMA